MNDYMNEEQRKFADLHREAQRIEISRDITEMKSTLAVVQEFLEWCDTYSDKAVLVDEIHEHGERLVDLNEDPMKVLFNIGICAPARLTKIMRKVYMNDLAEAAKALRHANNEYEKAMDLADRQAVVIRRLRKLVAPGKLKKFDAERKS